MLRLRTFGAVSVAGTERAPHGAATQRRRLALLVVVAVAGERGVSRETLRAMLWPEAGEETARQALAQHLEALRRDLACEDLFAGVLELRVNAARLSCDVTELEQAMQNGDPDRAAALYDGPFLDGFTLSGAPEFERWAEAERTRLASLAAQAFERAAEAQAAGGNATRALAHWKRLAAFEPLNTAVARRTIEAFDAAGNRAGALQFARVHEAMLRQGLDTEPHPAFVEWLAALRRSPSRNAVASVTPTPNPANPGDNITEQPTAVAMAPPTAATTVTATGAARRELPGRPIPGTLHGMPDANSSFIGRESELREAAQLLTTTRLVTVVGPGGLGKSRLAAQLAQQQAAAFSDGVWWVELAAVDDPGLVAGAVASRFGLAAQADRSALQLLTEHLRQRVMLLVLDNCEHLAAACAPLVTALLRGTTDVRVLATSREAFGVAGEVIWPLPPLGIPPDADTTPVTELAQSESVMLFRARARAAQPALRVGKHNLRAVSRICRWLDGIPLAIELVAARVRTLSVEQIADRLADRLQPRGGTDDAALPRDRTLHAILHWSYELLSDSEQAVLRRLSVFAGGCTGTGAAAVAGAASMPAREVVELIGHLVEKSLLTARDREGETRYELPETVRQYARDMLRAAGSAESDACRGQHAAYCLQIVGEAAPHLTGVDRNHWLDRIDVEHENIRAALGWAQLASDGGATSLQLIEGLCWYWYFSARWKEGRSWLEGALLLPAAQPATPQRAVLLRNAGLAAWLHGNDRLARSRLEECADIWRAHGAPQQRGTAMALLSQVLLSLDEMCEARAVASESVVLCPDDVESGARALALASLANVLLFAGDLDGASRAAAASEATFRALGDSWALSLPVRTAALIALARNELARPDALFREAVALCVGARDHWFLSRGLDGLASVATRAERGPRAARLLGAAERLREAVGASVMPAPACDPMHNTSALRALLGETAFEEAMAAGRAMSLAAAVHFALAQTDDGPRSAVSPYS